MLFKGLLASSMSGTIGGVVASHHGTFGHFQSRRMNTNRNTPEQQGIRNVVAQLVAMWGSSLSGLQRRAWDTYGANVHLANRLGQVIHNAGLTMYIRANVARSQASADRIDDAPQIFNLGVFSAPQFLVASEVTQRVGVAFGTDTGSDPWASEVNSHLLIYVGRPQNPGIGRYRGSYRFMIDVEGNPVPPPPGIAAVSPFRFSIGQRIFGRAAVTYSDGRYTSDSFFTGIATL